MDDIERHNRRVMLQRVKTYWLQGVLEESLHGAELIDLGLAYRPSAVAGSHNPQWQGTAEYDIPLKVGTKISDVFTKAGGELLILGEPGAGKTTMLLQLVSDLLHMAERDEQAPMPVVFSLASWSNNSPLGDWLAEELSNNYEVPRKLGEAWLAENRFIPLLDGLDEVEREARAACADAINDFRVSHGGVSILVTARSQDYAALGKRLRLDKAIVLQPLSLEQIDAYLESHGPRLAGVRAALHVDATLRELAQTPLMLSIMTLAYYRMPADYALSLAHRGAGQKLLFDVYVERMARYRRGDEAYAQEDTVRWLGWLARMISAQNRTIFFVENIQPNWLPRERQRALVDRVRLTVGLACVGIGLLAGLLGIPAYGWLAPVVGLGLGALTAVPPVLFGWLLVRTRVNWYKIETTEALDWSWPWAWLSLGVGTVLGALLGLPLTFLATRAGAQVPSWLLLPVFVSAALVLDTALIRSEVKMRTTAGQGLAHSARNGRRVGIVSTVIIALAGGLVLGVASLLGTVVNWLAALPWLLGGAFYLGLMGGLAYGGLAALQFRRLHAALHADGVMPENYIHFLDYAAERNLLRKVGGGYTFVHALLLDYFKTL